MRTALDHVADANDHWDQDTAHVDNGCDKSTCEKVFTISLDVGIAHFFHSFELLVFRANPFLNWHLPEVVEDVLLDVDIRNELCILFQVLELREDTGGRLDLVLGHLIVA